jgi:Flp pilus assembly protein TadD
MVATVFDRAWASQALAPAHARRTLAIVVASVVALGLAAYSNSFGNPFQFDDLHSIVDNPYVRSLKHVPTYFADARTFTRFLPNADYRPLLQVTYAIDYAIAGYAPWIWHATNLAMHLWVAVCLFLLGRRLVGIERVSDAPLDTADGELVSVVAALLFTVHPYAASCVNYISTRSSLMVAALLMPATLAYLSFIKDGRRRDAILSAALFALALLTKVEAISFVAVVVLADLLFLAPARLGATNAERMKRVTLHALPFVAIAVAYLLLRKLVVPPEFAQYSAPPDVTPIEYQLTELSAWWYYVGKIVAPVRFIADYSSYPVSRSIDLRVAASLAGWCAVALCLMAVRRRAPQAPFLAGAFLIHLAPTSSIVPIAQMVNEHRPYLPCVGLFLLVAYAIWRIARRNAAATLAAASVACLALGAVTHARNRVFSSEEAFWADVVEKDPASPRAHVNFGIELMRRGDLAGAERAFVEATRLEPGFLFAHLNLGMVLAQERRFDEARAELDEAVRIAPTLADPYYWRGLFRHQAGDAEGALADLEAAVARASVPTRELKALAELLASMGRVDEARRAAQRGAALDPAAFADLLRRL